MTHLLTNHMVDKEGRGEAVEYSFHGSRRVSEWVSEWELEEDLIRQTAMPFLFFFFLLYLLLRWKNYAYLDVSNNFELVE